MKFINFFNNINLFKAFLNQGARYIPTTTISILSKKEARAINTNSTPIKLILLQTTTRFPIDRRLKQRELSIINNNIIKEQFQLNKIMVGLIVDTLKYLVKVKQLLYIQRDIFIYII